MAVLNFRARRKGEILPAMHEAKDILRSFLASNDYDLQDMVARGWELTDHYYNVKDADELMAKADAGYDSGLYKKAFSIYDNMEGKDAGAAFGKGLCYFYGNGVECDREKAMDAFEEAANLGSAKAFVALSECLYEEGDEESVDKAVICAFKALELDMENQDALEILNKCTRQPFEDCSEARAYWRKQLINTPEIPLWDAAFAHYLQNEYDEAIDKGIQGVKAGDLRNAPIVIAQAITDKYGDDDKLHLEEARRWILLSLQNGSIDEAKLYIFLLCMLVCWAWDDDIRENDPELADLLRDATNIVSESAIVYSNDKSNGYYILGVSLFGNADKELGENLLTVASDLGNEGATAWLNGSSESSTEEDAEEDDAEEYEEPEPPSFNFNIAGLGINDLILAAADLEEEGKYTEAGWHYLKAIERRTIPNGKGCLLVSRFIHRWVNDPNYPKIYKEDKPLLEALSYNYLKLSLMDYGSIMRTYSEDMFSMLAIYTNDGVGCFADKIKGQEYVEWAFSSNSAPKLKLFCMSTTPSQSSIDDLSGVIDYDVIIKDAIRGHLAYFKKCTGDTAERISYLSHICRTYNI